MKRLCIVAIAIVASVLSTASPILIASGDIVDFAQTAAWPRFTKTESAITFANDVAYTHYQVLFPTVRTPGSANSMQIAEVELIGDIVQ